MPEFPPKYAPLTAFVAPALGHTQLWRTLAGLALTAVLYTLALQLISTTLLAALGPSSAMVTLRDIATGATPLGLVGLLFTYLPLAIGLGVATVLILKRGFSSLIGPLAPAWRCFLWVALPLLALWVAMMPLQIMAPNVGRHLGLWSMLQWLPLALPGLLIQTGTEELVFRGYLQQQLGARWRSPWMWMVVPAVLFGALHWSPEAYGPLAPLVALWAVAFGLAAADLTARTGNLGAAVGLHFANNAQTLFLVGLYGNLHGLSLYTVVLPMTDTMAQLPYIAVDGAALLVSWLAARVVLRV